MASVLLLCNILVMLLRSGLTVPGGKIKECSGTRCKLCKLNMLNLDPETKNYHGNNVHCISNNFSCGSSNIIYIIECKAKNCQFQYIGETKQTLRARVSGHRSSLHTKKGCPHLVSHFTKEHSPKDMLIKPIEQIFNNDDKLRRKREACNIKDFGTLFPYGGNERLEDPYLDAQEHFDNGNCIFSLFNHPKSTRGKRGSKSNNYVQPSVKQQSNSLDPKQFIRNIVDLKKNGDNYRRLLFLEINKLRKDDVIVLQKYNQSECSKFSIHNVVTDLCRHYISKIAGNKKEKSSNFIVFTYTNRYLEEINLNQICNYKEITSLYPAECKSEFSASYKYSKTIRSSILNYNTTLLKDLNCPTTCECSRSEFVDPQLGHIVTGDLSIIQNRALRNLVSKGVNFRECHRHMTDHVIKSVEMDLDAHIKKSSVRKSLPESTFGLWKAAILDSVTKKIGNLKIRRSHKPKLKNSVIKSYLDELHNKYVFVPTDKASNNVSIICKKYYIQTLEEELQSATYEFANGMTEEVLVNKHKKELKDLGIAVDDDQLKLPFIYWTAKQHKNPVGSRFIVSGKHCSTKTLSKKLSFVFKLIMKTLRNHCKFKAKFLKTSLYWIIDNSKSVHDSIRFINSNSRGKSVFTYDFSRLYTNIPHDLLLKQMQFVVKEAFLVKSDKAYIRVTSSNASWSKTDSIRNPNTMILTADQINSLLTYLLDNLYIKYFERIFKQIIGIPMGSDCGPDLANLFLFAYEYQYIIGLIEKGDYSYSTLRFIFRYIDDLIVLNDKGLFNTIFSNIYPSILDLNSTNITINNANFLDMNIDINSSTNKFDYKLYDKRNDFSFKVISLPNLDSNIPKGAAHSVIYSQVLRFFKATNVYEHFINSLSELRTKMIQQQFSKIGIEKEFKKFFIKNKYEVIAKFWEQPSVRSLS